jgi:hypothetical protein
MLFYYKDLRGRKAPLPFVAGARNTVILRGPRWSAHASDGVGFYGLALQPRVFLPIRCPFSTAQCTWDASVRVTGTDAGEVGDVSGVFSE